MIAGFTGTRTGMTPEQQTAFCRLLISLSVTDLHHGDCVGADAEAHALCLAVNIRLHVHPSINPKHRAFCTGYDFIDRPAASLVRNQVIVHRGINGLIAVSKTFEEEHRSGTWMTVRTAHKLNKTLRVKRPIWIIYPDGKVVIE